MTPRHSTLDTLTIALAGAALTASLLLGAHDVAAAQASQPRPAIVQRLPRGWRIAVPDRRHIQYSPAGRTGRTAR